MKSTDVHSQSLFQKLRFFMRGGIEAPPDEREPVLALLETQTAYSVLTSRFVVVLSLAASIATFGLIADSPVSIVGAMLIAPLMKPISALTYGLISGKKALRLRALLTLVVGICITMAVAAGVEQIIGVKGPTDEILARTKPNLIDLGVAVAAGLAAAMAATRKSIADTLPGVAIAVALVPPLCVSGMGFSIGAPSIGAGALVLFAVNLVAIILCGAAVFVAEGYGEWRRAKWGLAVTFIIAAVLTLQLIDAMGELREDDRAQDVVETYLHERYPIDQKIHPNDLSRLGVIEFPEHVFVFVELRSPEGGLTEEQGQELQRRLKAGLGSPVNLKIQFLLSEEMRIYEYRNASGKVPAYGQEDLIPRR